MPEHIAHSGAWALAIIMIVVASWVFYRYLAPRKWRDWTGAGLVQAFIIALYAEMYGFPLTIYALVRVFGLDRQYVSANLWSTLLGMGETGMMVAMIIGYVVLFTGIGLIIEGWRELYRARQENRLVTDSLYAFVRHPQYLGLFIALFGEGIIHWPTILSVVLFPVIALAYYWLARKEERDVLAKFGDKYQAYMRRVPAFIPRWGQWRRLVDAANERST
jgi:protein-S-isoprenylcysteine O-methyltransferase Ste14